jgi:RNA methyltransferase, TrmH family
LITSASNPEVRAVAALRDRSERESTDLCLVEGEVEIRRALQAGIGLETLYVREGVGSPLVDQVARVVTLSNRAFERIAYGRNGVVAVARRPQFGLADLVLPKPELLLIVEGLEKPGNLGAILRTANAVGAGVVAASSVTDLTNPNVIRASLGTVFTVPLATGSTNEVIGFLRERNISLAVAVVTNGKPPWQVDLTNPVAVAIGSEDRGLSPELTAAADLALTLPMAGGADSLNASVTAAVMLYESVRQRALENALDP